jgi:hypothetical protein
VSAYRAALRARQLLVLAPPLRASFVNADAGESQTESPSLNVHRRTGTHSDFAVYFLVMITARAVAIAGVVVLFAGAGPASGKTDALYALRYGAKTNLLVPYDPVRLVPSGSPIRMG